MRYLLLGGCLLLASCAGGRGTLNGYRTLKNGTRLLIVSQEYCPESAVILTPSVEVGDPVSIKDWGMCSDMITQFDTVP